MQSEVPNGGFFGPLTDRQLNIIRGKALVGHATIKDILTVFGHLDYLEEQLDALDLGDTFGTEGWRHLFGMETT